MKLFALLLVVVCFAWLVLWVFWPSNRARLEAHGSIALDDEAPKAARADQDRADRNKDATHE
jgi:cbb3-type cytochrome oxidase subunit 3